MENLDAEISNRGHLNISIEIDEDITHYYLLTHCRWLPSSAFITARPIDVSNKIFMCHQKFFIFVLMILNKIAIHWYNSNCIPWTVNYSDIISEEPHIQIGKFWAVAGRKVNDTRITIATNENEVPPTACRLSNSLTELSYTNSTWWSVYCCILYYCTQYTQLLCL